MDHCHTSDITSAHAEALEHWEEELNLPQGFSTRVDSSTSSTTNTLESAKNWFEHNRPPKQNFWPALIIAFIAQAEAVLNEESRASISDVFRAVQTGTKQRRKVVNSLNFITSTDKQISLRPLYNDAEQIIRVKLRREHPSSAAHATQAWRDYQDLIVLIYRMSPSERSQFARLIWQRGVVDKPQRTFATKAKRIIRPFEKVLIDFDTRNAKPGGALFQSLVFGYFLADSPNLTLESHSVNTGSSRASMPGDVAGFRGPEVELVVEVKDQPLTKENINSVLTDFLEDVAQAPNATAVVVADTIDEMSHLELRKRNVIALSRSELAERTITWDLPKQQEALRGALYYLHRIQKKADLAHRLEEFLNANQIERGITSYETNQSE